MSEIKTRGAKQFARVMTWLVMIACAMTIASCANNLPAPPREAAQNPTYHIGPGDSLHVFVWQNPDLSTTVTVRPDGRVSLPLVSDILAAGKTPTQLSKDIESRLTKYVNGPIVTVMVTSFVGLHSEEIRVVGEAAKPSAMPYRKGMTVLDVMIAVGGLTQYADGDRARLVRTVARGRVQESYALLLNRLLKDGDISANVSLEPGDIIIIPQTFF